MSGTDPAAAETASEALSWLMFAGVNRKPKLAPEDDPNEIVYDYPAGNARYPQAHGYDEIVAVRAIETADGPYWGWLNNRFGPADFPSMVFRRKTLFNICFPYLPEAEEKAGRGRIVRLAIEPLHTCRSSHHDRPEPAATTGVFDCSAVNGRAPESDSHYCLRCAVKLHDAGMFTPTDGTRLPTAEKFLATFGPNEDVAP